MKKFKVTAFYNGSKTEVTVTAIRATDARRHVETFFKGCRVLSVTDIPVK